MKRTRVDSIETVVRVGEVNGANGSDYAVVVKRIVSPTEKSIKPTMVVDVYRCSNDGSYDQIEDRVIKVRGVDTLDLQFLLNELKNMTAALTGVHVNI